MDRLTRTAGTIRGAGLAVAALAVIGGGGMLLGGLVVRLAHHPAAVAVVAVLVLAGGLLVAIGGTRLRRRVPRHTILELPLATAPPETAGANPLAALTGSKVTTLREVVETIERAATDKRVDGILLRVNLAAAGMAQLQELRDGIRTLRSAGKFAIAFAELYGNASYYLASACDEVLLQPGSEVAFVGLGRDVNFLKTALDRLGVALEAEGRWEYKNAANQLLEDHFTGPHREALERLMEATFDQIVAGVAAERSLDPQTVRAVADRGPLLDREAVEAGLIDALAFRDEAVQRCKDRVAASRSRLMLLADYKKRAGRGRGKGKGKPVTVGLITATGQIVTRRQDAIPLSTGGFMEADNTGAAIRAAVADKRVKAIVLRVDSPGGSAVASNTIWRETVRARAAGKPVVVSMGNVAASGGYDISASADRIVAQPGTVTGSIGVIGGKPILAGAKRRAGINVEELRTSANANIYSLNRPFTESHWARFRASLDATYEEFVGRVADGRGLSFDQAEGVARGRVWIGSDARERGLVDELGGLTTAVRLAKEAVGAAATAPARIKEFPKKPSALARLTGEKPRASDEPAAALLAMLGEAALPVADLLRGLGLTGEPGELHCGLQPSDWMVR